MRYIIIYNVRHSRAEATTAADVHAARSIM